MLTWIDILVLFVAAALGPLGSFWIFRKYQDYCLNQYRKTQQTVEQLLSNRDLHFPFGLPIAETWSAGEYICDKCGRNGYFSMTRVPANKLPPELRQQQESDPQGMIHRDGRASVTHENLWYAPAVIKCQHCGTLLANGDLARALMQQEEP